MKTLESAINEYNEKVKKIKSDYKRSLRRIRITDAVFGSFFAVYTGVSFTVFAVFTYLLIWGTK